MKYTYPVACILALACAMWIAYAAEQQGKQTNYFQRVGATK